MTDKWFLADPHLNHKYMVNPDENGVVYRPEFKTIEEMNEIIINNINRVVKPKDKLYLIGDVVFQPASSEELLRSINGKKRLIMGNHDEIRAKTKYYTKIYDEICLWKKFKNEGFVCTHIPLRTDGMRGCFLNVHGHTHRILMPEPCYMNISAENINYTPIHFDQIREKVKEVARMILDGSWQFPTVIEH